MPKIKERKVPSTPVKQGVPLAILDQRISDINKHSLAEIERLERLVKTYGALVNIMEQTWEPKKPTHKDVLKKTAALKATIAAIQATAL